MLTKSPSAKAVVAGSGALLAATFIALASANLTPAIPARNLTVIYVGADNCAPCNTWLQNQGTAFRESPEFQRLTYHEVKSSNLFEVLNDRNWPEQLRIYRQAIGQGAGVPLWFIIANDQIVLQSSGLTQWQQTVLPKIKSLLH